MKASLYKWDLQDLEYRGRLQISIQLGQQRKDLQVKNIYIMVATDIPHKYKQITQHCLTICFLHCHSSVIIVSVMHA